MVQGYVSSLSSSPTSICCPWFPAGWSAWDREGVATSALIQSPPQPGASCISLETGPSESSPLCLSRWSLLVWDKVCSCPFPHWPFLQLQSGSLCPEVVGLPALPTPSEGSFLWGDGGLPALFGRELLRGLRLVPPESSSLVCVLDVSLPEPLARSMGKT